MKFFLPVFLLSSVMACTKKTEAPPNASQPEATTQQTTANPDTTATANTTPTAGSDQTTAEIGRRVREEIQKAGPEITTKNVEVVSRDNALFLQGIVTTEKEKAQIFALARKIAPEIQDDLKIDASKPPSTTPTQVR